MKQLDMFMDQPYLTKTLKNRAVIRELNTQYLKRVEKFWGVINEDHREASCILQEIETIARKLHKMGKYDIFCLKFKCVVVDPQGREVKRGMQAIIYAEDQKEALELLSMQEWLHRKSGDQRCSVRYTRPKFIAVPKHLKES